MPKRTHHASGEPHEYPRRVLLAATGLSPQVVTETVYALAVVDKPQFLPVSDLSLAEKGIETLFRTKGRHGACPYVWP